VIIGISTKNDKGCIINSGEIVDRNVTIDNGTYLVQARKEAMEEKHA